MCHCCSYALSLARSSSKPKQRSRTRNGMCSHLGHLKKHGSIEVSGSTWANAMSVQQCCACVQKRDIYLSKNMAKSVSAPNDHHVRTFALDCNLCL